MPAMNAAERDLEPIVEEFFRDGVAVVSGVLNPDEVAAMRAKTDDFARDPDLPARHRSYNARRSCSGTATRPIPSSQS